MKKCTKFDNNIIVIPGRRNLTKPYHLPGLKQVSQDGSIEEDFPTEQGKTFLIDMQSSSPNSHFRPLSMSIET